MIRKVFVLIGFVALTVWAGTLAYIGNPNYIEQNLLITVGIAAFLCIMAVSCLKEEKCNSHSRGLSDARKSICSGVDMRKVPVQGNKFFKKTLIFPCYDGQMGMVVGLKSSVEEIQESEFNNLKREG